MKQILFVHSALRRLYLDTTYMYVGFLQHTKDCFHVRNKKHEYKYLDIR